MNSVKLGLVALALMPLAACGGGGGAASNTPPSVTQSQATADFATLGSAYTLQGIDATVGASNVAAPTTGTFNYAGHTRIINLNDSDGLFYGRTDYAIDFDTDLVAGEVYSVKDDANAYASTVTFAGTVADDGALTGTMSGTRVRQITLTNLALTTHTIDADLTGNLIEDEDGQKLTLGGTTGTRTSGGTTTTIRVNSVAERQ